METSLTYEDRISLWISSERGLKKVFKMRRYTNVVKMRILVDQKVKLNKVFEFNGKSITIRLMFANLNGEDVIALTNSQLDRLVEAYEEKKGLTVKILKTQLSHNIKIEGGFLPALAGLIPFLTETVLTALGVGALSGLARTGVQKLIGNGLYLKKGSGAFRIETGGEALYLGIVNGGEFENVVNSLYLMKQGRLYDGRGLILGPNSPFKNIPVLV